MYAYDNNCPSYTILATLSLAIVDSWPFPWIYLKMSCQHLVAKRSQPGCTDSSFMPPSSFKSFLFPATVQTTILNLKF